MYDVIFNSLEIYLITLIEIRPANGTWTETGVVRSWAFFSELHEHSAVAFGIIYPGQILIMMLKIIKISRDFTDKRHERGRDSTDYHTIHKSH